MCLCHQIVPLFGLHYDGRKVVSLVLVWCFRGGRMIGLRTGCCLAVGLALAACAENRGLGFGPPAPDPAVAAVPRGPTPAPPRIQAQELVGRWGFAAFHRPEDRPRIETQARAQCGTPYVISASADGGVTMFGHDNPNLQEMTTKGTVEGKTYVGPPGDPAGSEDRARLRLPPPARNPRIQRPRRRTSNKKAGKG